MVEVLGTLGNLHCPSLDMTETCVEHGLLEYAAILSPGRWTTTSRWRLWCLSGRW